MAQDSFDTATARVPTSVPVTTYTIRLTDDAGGTAYAATYAFDVLDQDGRAIEARTGNLLPHLTTAERDALKAVFDNLHAKAQGVVA